jgi:hypothetical protein
MVVKLMVPQRKMVVAVLILILALAAVFFVVIRAGIPPSTPVPNYFIHTNPQTFSVPQGSTITVNITVDSILDKKMSISFGNLTIEQYQYMNLTRVENQKQIFNYTFYPDPIIVPPNGNSTGVLTVNFAEDAPLGQYQMDYFEKSNISYQTGSGFLLNITRR